ncbi:MAG TPA: hypothetical protein VGK13_04905 [Methanocellaceae archaeon]
MQEQVSAKSGFSFGEGFLDVRAVALILINMAATLLVYVPFLSYMAPVYRLLSGPMFAGIAKYLPALHDPTFISRYLDGPLYIYVAKTLYVVPAQTPFNLPGYYFACHLALFPLLIRLFSSIGYEQAMIFIVIVSSTLAVLIFYMLVKEFKYSVDPFWLSVVFIFFPSRWLLYHSIGASEPLFVMLVLASIYCLKKDWAFAACLLAGLATITKIFGLLLFVSYVALFIYKKQYRSLPYALFIPAFLGMNFLIYQFTYGDFFAYFRWNGSFLCIVPFMDFFSPALKGQTDLAELFMAIYVVYLLGVLRLRRHLELFAVALPFALFMAFVWHPDISRYMLPIAPLALLIGFDDIMCRKEFKWIFPLVILFGYIYCWGIIPTNLMTQAQYSYIMGLTP